MAGYTEKDLLFGHKKMSLWQIAKRTARYLRGEWWAFALAILLLGMSIVGNMSLPILLEHFTNSLDFAISNATAATMIGLGLGYIGIVAMNQVFLYCEAMLLQRAGQKIVYNMRNEVFQHVEEMSIS